MVDLVRMKGSKRGIIGRKLKPDKESYRYVEHMLFLALQEQPFFCAECGGGNLNPNDYETISDIHICPFCHNVEGFGFTYWSPGIGCNVSLDVCINAEVPTCTLMIIMLMKVAQQHGVKLNFFQKDGEKYIPI